jgi:hypothetical protein
MSEFPISNGPFGSGGSDQGLNQILQERQSLAQSQLSQLQPKGPSMFRQVLGGVAGMAGNMFAPGLGGALGRMIGGGGSSSLSGSFGSGNSSAFASNLASSAAAANASNLAGAEALNTAAQQSNEVEEMVELQANLEKARHESFMSVIQSIGSS